MITGQQKFPLRTALTHWNCSAVLKNEQTKSKLSSHKICDDCYWNWLQASTERVLCQQEKADLTELSTSEKQVNCHNLQWDADRQSRTDKQSRVGRQDRQGNPPSPFWQWTQLPAHLWPSQLCLTCSLSSNSSAKPEILENAFVLWEHSWKNGGKTAMQQSQLNRKDCRCLVLFSLFKKIFFFYSAQLFSLPLPCYSVVSPVC